MSTESEEDSDEQEGKSQQETPKDVVKMVIRKTIATTPISILIESLVKNLCAMIEKDEKRALKIYNIICSKLYEMKLIDESYQMTEFEGMRGQYERALYHLVKTARGGEELPKSIERMWSDEDLHTEWSHYQREFDEIAFIAGGGFGQVFRVRHKLDATEYAVKKIFIRSNGIKSVMNYLAEVKTFASLNHSNIVQYKAAWLELGVPRSTKNLIQHVENTSSAYIYPDVISNIETSIHSPMTKSKSSDFIIQFESNELSKKYSHSNVHLATTPSSRETRNSISEGGKAICMFKEDDDFIPKNKWATLYIQMALCQITLKQWLEKRNHNDLPSQSTESALVQSNTKMRRDTIMEILRQLLQGLRYIHSRGIVHHDIKPSNIFLQVEDGNLCVQLGDFGLACPLQNTKHSLALGTKLYAAPEQLEGKCDSKSDVYSLGVVLLELVETFRTDMERVHCITKLRKGNLPAYLTAREPQLAHIISQLVTRYPHNRPSATQLLQSLANEADDSLMVQQLKLQLAEKDSEINRLKGLLKAAGVDLNTF